MPQPLRSSPIVRELARLWERSQDEVLQALEASSAHEATSLDRPRQAGDEEAGSLGDRVLASTEAGFEHVDRQDLVRDLLDGLPERDRRIIEMRFFEDMTQPEIAERVGVSQSYLSRVLRRTL